MDKIKTYIINFNRLEWPLAMAEYLIQVPEIEVVFIDNNSTYIPLLEWYEKQNRFEVIRLNQNYGHKVFWEQNIIEQASDYYIVTDPDLDLSKIPLDFMEVLKEGFDKFPYRCKCGFSLEIDDFIEKTNYQQYITNIESSYWNMNFDGKFFYNSAIDTTFALYHKSRGNNLTGVRTGRPYVARHLPWYYTKDNLTEEDIYYINSATESCSAKPQMEQFLNYKCKIVKL